MKSVPKAKAVAAPKLHHRRILSAAYPFIYLPIVIGVLLLAINSVSLSAFSKSLVTVWSVLMILGIVLYDLTTAHSLLANLFYTTSKFFGRDYTRKNLEEGYLVFTRWPDRKLFTKRHQIRWKILGSTVAVCWIFSLLFGMTALNSYDYVHFGIMFSAFLFSQPSFGAFVNEVVVHIERSKPNFFGWFVLSSVGALMGAIGVFFGTRDLNFAALIFVTFGSIIVPTYLNRRTWSGERSYNAVLQRLTERISGTQNILSSIQKHLPGLIGESLRYDRVSILLPNLGEQGLRIQGYFSKTNDASRGLFLDSENGGITNKAFVSGKSILWNDVSLCSYFLRVGKNDETKAELAVPIVYQNKTYGVIDIQSDHEGVFGLQDVNAIESVADTLAVALWSGEATSNFLHSLGIWTQLWQGDYGNEDDLLENFARYIMSETGADKFVYYWLSPTGFPVGDPVVFIASGKFEAIEKMKGPFEDLSSPMLGLIANWEYVSAEDVKNDTRFFNPAKGEESFVEREGIKSSCFVPIGIKSEPIGIFYLNYKTSKKFDDRFHFMCKSFSQSFAPAAWMVRYRRIIYEGYGRPEIHTHVLVGRHGLKSGIMPFLDELREPEYNEASKRHKRTEEIFTNVENFIGEVTSIESSSPPTFLRNPLEPALNQYRIYSRQQDDTNLTIPPVDFDYKIERENSLVKLAIFRFVAEGIQNAIYHGGATDINTHVYRREAAIEVIITNDGDPIPRDAMKRGSKRGVVFLKEEFAKVFGATTTIGPRPDGAGGHVSTLIPALPLSLLIRNKE